MGVTEKQKAIKWNKEHLSSKQQKWTKIELQKTKEIQKASKLFKKLRKN